MTENFTTCAAYQYVVKLISEDSYTVKTSEKLLQILTDRKWKTKVPME